MKLKILKVMYIIVAFLIIGMPVKSEASISSEGYEITAYDINMIVNEDNSFEITETIETFFSDSDKHGIIRKIPLTNNVKRLDGTESNNKAKISDIKVSEEYEISSDSGYKVIKIGDANQTINGKHTYIISYTYNIGKDPLKNEDEFYFNLIGDEWDTSIGNVTFSITMPKEFDQSTLGFSSGTVGKTNDSNIIYQVNNNVISGYLKTTLSAGQALTVRLTLPEGYFEGSSIDLNIVLMLIKTLICILIVIVAIEYKKTPNNISYTNTIEFHPPDDINSAELGFIYKGKIKEKDVLSLLIFLANKGYLRIDEDKNQNSKKEKSNNYKIVKLKEYDGKNENEKEFFEEIFKNGKTVVEKDKLGIDFYRRLDRIRSNIKYKKEKEIFEPCNSEKRKIFIVMIAIVYLIMCLYAPIEVLFPVLTLWFISLFILDFLYRYPSVRLGIFISCAYSVVAVLCIYLSYAYNLINIELESVLQILSQDICLITLIMFLAIKQRTEYGRKMLARIKGFKKFLKITKKSEIEKLVMEEPQYFYDILPYTYVLGISNKWMKKFEDLTHVQPNWYYGSNKYSIKKFDYWYNLTYKSVLDRTYEDYSKTSARTRSFRGGSGGNHGDFRRFFWAEDSLDGGSGGGRR